jgi:hypothetical protein
MIKKTFGLFWFTNTALQACPFCASELAQNNGGFSLGINATIFLLLGTVGFLAGFIVYQIVRQPKKPRA